MPKVLIYITTAMTGIYIILGVLILFTDYFDAIVSGTNKLILGVALFAYGSVRAFYFYKKMKKS